MIDRCESLSPLVNGIEEHVPCRFLAGHNGVHNAISEPLEQPFWSLSWGED